MTANAPRAPRAPRHLQEPGKDLWRRVVTVYGLEEHHLAVLEAACVARDRMEQARLTVEAEGLTASTRDGIKTHPAVTIERDSRTAMLRALRELGLDIEDGGRPGRPPSPWGR